MKCLLCDINPAMREAWEKELERRPRLAALCSVVAGGITDLRVDAVVSPANSFGFMRGGVDGVYAAFSGEAWKAGCRQSSVRFRGGTAGREALIVPTGHAGIRTDLRADHAQAFRAS
ncbi:MAG: hypothetical protein ACLSAH_02085 [Bilophila wadsworthia]